MPDPISPERVVQIAAAARVPLPPGAAERVARAIAVPVARFATGDAAVPFEAEPATFLAVAHADAAR
jgi:hypothetical protein